MLQTKSFLLRMGLGVLALALLGYFFREALRPKEDRRPPLVKPNMAVAAPKPPPVAPDEPLEAGHQDIFPLDDLLTESDDARAAFLYAQRLANLDLKQFPVAMEDLINRTFSDRREQFVAILLKRWIALDPIGALAAEVERASSESKYINVILATWAEVAPMDVWAWARNAAITQPEPSQSVPAAKAFAAAMKAIIDQKNFSLAATLSLEWGNSSGTLVNTWAMTDSAGASAWTLGLPPGPTRTAAVSALVHNFATTDLDLAMAFVMQLSRPDEILSSATAVGQTMMEKTGGKAGPMLNWISGLAGINETGIYDGSIVRLLMYVQPDDSFDLPSARRLLSSVKDPALRTLSAGPLIHSLMRTSRPNAAILSIELMTGQAQDQMLGPLMTQWANSDSETAMAFARNDPRIPENLRPKMIQWVNGGTLLR